MKIHGLMILSCSLLLAVSIYSVVNGKTVKSEHASEYNRSLSDLEQDQMTLAADMQRLRRNLRGGANPLQIARERDWILQDWRNIVADRGLKSDNVSAALANSVP